MKKIALILATGSLIAAGAAYAQPMGEPGERAPATRDAVITKTDEAFARMDANGDGVLSEADKEAMLAKHFAQMDTDGDGVLSKAEFIASHEARAEKREERREMRVERMGKRGGGYRFAANVARIAQQQG